MTKKRTHAVLWDRNGRLGITLDLPLLMIDLEEGDTKSGGFRKLRDLPLPRPMTSNQFNTFITSDEGKAWAKTILEEEMPE